MMRRASPSVRRAARPGAFASLLAASLILLLLPSGARADGLSGFLSPGDLAQDHADIEGITNCVQCHEAGAGVSPERCMVCHDEVKAQVDVRRGFHADRGEECASCHLDHKGRAFQMIKLVKEDFKHQSTGFALSGAHADAKIACKDCHTEEGTFTGLRQDCQSCHEQSHGVEESSRGLLAQCRTCHGTVDWSMRELAPDVFDHRDKAHVDYPLEGQHREVKCESCHRPEEATIFLPTKFDRCTSCHKDEHRKQFGARPCSDCHTVGRKKFHIPNYDHERTRWPLVGLHAKVRCATCHGKGRAARFVNLPHETCSDCHDDQHGGQFEERSCDACHSQDVHDFKLPDFDHEQTHYPLRGAHAALICDKCHQQVDEIVRYAGLASGDCVDCHEDLHEGKFPDQACSSCHLSEQDWSVGEFDHDLTEYPLSGAHVEVKCESCHLEGKMKGTSFASCLDCHEKTNPHPPNLAADSCEGCHDTDDWKQVRFDHAEESKFPLLGLHEPLACESCHKDNDFSGLETTCASCHEQERPEHHFTGACVDCHGEHGWQPATLGELGHDVTGFPLRGVHAQASCEDCHRSTEPSPAASPECISCHASDDAHDHLLGDACGDCHNERSWFMTSWRHDSMGFPLRGMHRLAACEDCHATGFAGTPRDCGRCHQERALAVGGEVHTSAFSNQCDACHNELDWENVRTPHGDLD